MSIKGAAKSILKPVYYRLPARFCYGPQFQPTFKLLEQSERWSEDRLTEFQITKLRAMLRHCARHVPYYRRLFGEAGFDPESVRDARDLRALPLLDKETVRANMKEFLAETISPREMLYFTT